MRNAQTKVFPAEPDQLESIISTEQLTKVYDTGDLKVEALKGIDLTVEKGD